MQFLQHTSIVKIVDLTRTINYWTWTLEFYDGSRLWARREYETSFDGDGLWINQPSKGWQQIAGTTQFIMPATNQVSYIIKYFEK
jgi:hypothetical protein